MSARKPPINGMKSIGHAREEVTKPNRKGESVISQTIQARRKTRICRAMLELARPAHKMRKLATSKATTEPRTTANRSCFYFNR